MVEIIKEFIPPGRPNRPGNSLTARYITIHDTGNSEEGADARSHSHWVRNNPDPQFLSSWHFTVDDRLIIQQLPLSEHGWHAGDGANGTGNRQSIGIEICENEDGQRELAEDNAARLCAQLIKEIPTLLTYPDCMKQHYHWTGKNCPRVMRGKAGGWENFLARIAARRQGEETVELSKAIVLGSYVDFVLAEPLALHLDAPIFLRGALGQLKAAEIYVAGGGTKGITGGGKIIDLSGANRFETAQNISRLLSSIR